MKTEQEIFEQSVNAFIRRPGGPHGSEIVDPLTKDGVIFKLGMTLYQRNPTYNGYTDLIESEGIPTEIKTSHDTHEIRWGNDGDGWGTAKPTLGLITDDSLRGLGPVNEFYSSPQAAACAYVEELTAARAEIDAKIANAREVAELTEQGLHTPVVKRFAVFAGDNHEPSGGWQDFATSFDTLEAALAYKPENEFHWTQIVDLLTGQEIE